MTYYSNLTRNPDLVPNCTLPDAKSCDGFKCSWHSANHSYQFFPCSKPQAFRLVLTSAEGTFNKTFDASEMVKLNDNYSLDVTVKHPGDQTFGLQVHMHTHDVILVSGC